MPRQQTLGTLSNSITNTLFDAFLHLAKFITMPPGKKAPPQQSSLTEWWGSKQKKQGIVVPAATPDKDKGLPKLAPPPPETDSTTDACPTEPPSERASHFSRMWGLR